MYPDPQSRAVIFAFERILPKSLPYQKDCQDTSMASLFIKLSHLVRNLWDSVQGLPVCLEGPP